MKRFRYGFDGLALIGAACYGIVRFGVKRHVHHGFIHDHLLDVLFIPTALPWVLWLQQRLRIRGRHGVPTWAEIFLHWLIWSVICEGVGPAVFHHGTADVWDVVAYAAGAIVAGLWWNRRISEPNRGRLWQPAIAREL